MSTKTKNLILSIIVVIVASTIPALIWGKWLEAIIFLVAHTLIRPQFKRQFHHIIPAICRQITGIVFFFGISFVIPIEYSFLSAVPINYLVGWVGETRATKDYYERKYLELAKQLNKPQEFNVLSCTEDELVARCKELGFSEENIELAIHFFIKKTKQSKIADMLFVDEKSVQQHKRRMKQKLNK